MGFFVKWFQNCNFSARKQATNEEYNDNIRCELLSKL